MYQPQTKGKKNPNKKQFIKYEDLNKLKVKECNKIKLLIKIKAV